MRPPRVLFLVENMSVPADVRVWSECVAVKEAGFRVTVVCPLGQTRDRSRFEVVDGVALLREAPGRVHLGPQFRVAI